MSRLTPVTDDQTLRLRALERRLAELEARARAGLIARLILRADSSPFTGDATTDLTVPAAIDTSRTYEIGTKFQWDITAGFGVGLFVANVHADGIQVDRVGVIGDLVRDTITATVLWEPTVSGTTTVDIRLDELNDGATVVLRGSNTAGAIHTRELWVKDAGPRLE